MITLIIMCIVYILVSSSCITYALVEIDRLNNEITNLRKEAKTSQKQDNTTANYEIKKLEDNENE